MDESSSRACRMRSDQYLKVSACTACPRKRLALRIADMRLPSVLPCNCICASPVPLLVTLGSRNKSPAWTMLLPRNIAFHQLRLQFASYLSGSIDAHADQSSPAGSYLPDARNADLLRFAVGDYGFFAHVEEHGPAHAEIRSSFVFFDDSGMQYSLIQRELVVSQSPNGWKNRRR